MPINVRIQPNQPTTLVTNLTDLTREKRFTFLTEDVVATGTTLRVQSVIGFESISTSSGQVICIGKIGDERTEILRSSNASGEFPSPATKTVFLRDSLIFDHPQDTRVTIVDWDRAEVQWAASVNSTKATVAAYPFNITPDVPGMLYVDTSATAGYFFVRFNNTIRAANSDFSDPVPYTGYDDNMVFKIKERALQSLGEEVDGVIITHEFLNQSLWEARREYHQSPGKRPFRRKFNIDIGNALTGSARIELPTDIEKPATAENLFGVRIGTNSNMTIYDKKDLDYDFVNIPHTTLTSAYTIGARDLYVTSTRDFADSGVVSIEGTSISYSAKSVSGGTLRISVDGSWDTSIGSDVWQNASYGLPDKFTVFADPGGSAYIYFNRPIDTAYINQNIYADYYRTLVGFNSDFDVLDEPDWDMYTPYLMAKIKHRRSKGTFDITTDPDYKLWQFKKQNALNKEFLGTAIRIQPDISHLLIPE